MIDTDIFSQSESSNSQETQRIEADHPLRSIIEHLTDGVILANENGLVVGWNRSLEDFTGIKREKVLHRFIWDVNYEIIPDANKTLDLYKRIKNGFRHVLKTGHYIKKAFDVEQDIQCANGVIRTVKVESYTIKTELGYLITNIVRDVTDRIILERSIHQRARELATLYEISLEITSQQGLSELLQKIVQRAIMLLNAQGGTLFLCDSEKRLVRPYFEYHEIPHNYQQVVFHYGEGAAGKVAQTGKPLIVKNYDVWHGKADVYKNDQYSNTTVLSVPLSWKGEVIGVLQVLGDGGIRSFNEADQELLNLFANQAAIAIENARLLDIERTSRQEAESISKAAVTLTSTLDLNRLLDEILTQLENVVPYDSASVMLIEGEHLHAVAARGFPDQKQVLHVLFPADNEIFREIRQTRKPVVFDDVQQNPAFQCWGNTTYVHGWLGVPLVVRDQVIGFITLDSRQKAAYDLTHAKWVESFANQAAIAIENARLYEAERQARERAEILWEVAQVISESLELNEVIRRILEQLKRVLKFNTTSVLLLGEKGNPDFVAGIGFEDERLTSKVASQVLSDSPILKQMYLDLTPVIIPDVRDHPDWIWVTGAEHVRSFMGVPIVARQKMIGVLMVDSIEARFYGEIDLQKAQLLAQHLAIAIQNARLFEAERSQLLLSKTLQDVGAMLTSKSALNEVLQNILDLLRRVVQYDSASIQLMQEDGTLALAAGYGFPDLESARRATQELKSYTFESKWRGKRLIVIPDTHKDKRWVVASETDYINSWISAPLLVKGKFIGCLNVDSKSKNAFDRAVGETVMAFANQAAIAIENARLFEVERKTRERAEALREAARIIGSSLSLNQVLEAVLDQIARVLNYDSGNIMLLEDEALVIKVWRGFDTYEKQPLIDTVRLSLKDDTAATFVLNSKEPLIIADVTKDPRWEQTIASEHIRSWVGVPLIVRDQVIGLLNLDRTTTGSFTDDEVALAQTFASHAATAIANASLFETEGKRAFELEALRQASLSLTASLELEGVLDAILMGALTLLQGANNSHIFLYSAENGGVLKFGAALWADGRKGEPFAYPRPDGLTYAVARSGEAIVVTNMADHPLYDHSPADWLGAIIGLPLKIGQRVVGVMNISYLEPRSFSEAELRMLHLLGDQAAVAIENARLYEQAANERRHIGLLYDLGREIGSSLEIDEIFNRAISLTTKALNGSVGEAFLFLPEKNQLYLRALHGRSESALKEYNERWDKRSGIGLPGWVAQEGLAANVADVLQETRWLPIPGVDEDVRSAISAPVFSGDKLAGVITVLHQQPGAFSADHMELLQAICQQVGLALSNANRYQEMKRRLTEMTLIQNLAQTFSRRLELQELLDEVVTQLAQLLDYPQVEIYLIEGDYVKLSAYYGTALIGETFLKDRGVIGRVVQMKKAVLLPNVADDPEYCPDIPSTVCELAVPIFRGDVVIGVINIETSVANQFGIQDLELLQVLAGQISIALENAVLYERLRLHADDLEHTVSRRTSELTELYELSQKIGYTFSYEDLFRLLLGHLQNAFRIEFVAGCLSLDNNHQIILYTLKALSSSAISELKEYLRTEFHVKKRGKQRRQIELFPLHDDRITPEIEHLSSLSNVPIQIGKKKAGLLIIEEASLTFGPEQDRLLRTFANQAANAIERMEAQLAAEKKKLESLIDHLPIGVLLLDPENRTLVSNSRGQEFLSTLAVQDNNGVISHLGEYTIEDLVSRSSGSMAVEIVLNGPKNRFFEVQAQEVGDQSRQRVVTLEEVTREREIQVRVQMHERLATVGQLAAGIAHDFNNIMAAILVYADLLRNDDSLSNTSKDRLAIIQQQVQRASSLIRQILDFSRRSVIEQSPIDLLPFIKEFEKMLRRVMPETIHLELAYKPGVYMINADPTRLQQVFMNLAVNARDAMQDGGLLHFEMDHYTLKPEDTPPLHYLPPGEWARIVVRDTGLGIASEHLPHVFEPFFSTKPAGVGTGLGLAQVYGIIKQHEGYIDVKSQLGQGTVFTIYLRLLDVPREDITTQDIPMEIDGQGVTVLVVEDDTATREALQALLEANHYNVLTASNGKEALLIYKQHRHEVRMLVSDVVMPEMGGLELYRVLRVKDEDVRMLFITGHPMEEERQGILEKGNIHWLQKPFSVKEFSQAVKELLNV